jgi:hypothetical protein
MLFWVDNIFAVFNLIKLWLCHSKYKLRFCEAYYCFMCYIVERDFQLPSLGKFIAKLSPSSSSSWAELALFSSLPCLHIIDPPLGFHCREGKLPVARVCRVTLGQLLKIPPFVRPNIAGGPWFLLGCRILIFLLVRPHAKFRNPRTNLEITPPVCPNIAYCGW